MQLDTSGLPDPGLPALPPPLPEQELAESKESTQPLEPPWTLDGVLLLGVGLLTSMAAGVLLVHALERYASHLNFAQRKYSTFLISNFCFQGVGLVLTHSFLRRHQMSWGTFLGITKPDFKRAIVLGVGVALVILLPGTSALQWLTFKALTWLQQTPDVQPTVQVLRLSYATWQQIVFGISAIVLAPLFEEILFRGVFFRFVKQLGYPRLAVIGTSVIFGLIHGSVAALVPLCFFAAVLAVVYDKTGNLTTAIVAHSFFNCVNFLLVPR